MTHVAVLLLSLVSLDVGRSRTITVPRSIERTLVRVGVGLAQSYGSEENLDTLCRIIEGNDEQIQIRNSRLYLNGQRDGYAWVRVLRSCYTLGLFVADMAEPNSSVELRYTVDYRGLAITRRVTISDGAIVSRASFTCTLGPQGRCKAIRMTAHARESPHGTMITTAATVNANSGICPTRSTSRLRVVNRLAGRSISNQLDSAMASAEREGSRLSATGHDAICGFVGRLTDRILAWTR
jgi:hypothetical protein